MSLVATPHTDVVPRASRRGSGLHRMQPHLPRRSVRRERLDVADAMDSPSELALRAVTGVHGLHR